MSTNQQNVEKIEEILMGEGKEYNPRKRMNEAEDYVRSLPESEKSSLQHYVRGNLNIEFEVQAVVQMAD